MNEKQIEQFGNELVSRGFSRAAFTVETVGEKTIIKNRKGQLLETLSAVVQNDVQAAINAANK